MSDRTIHAVAEPQGKARLTKRGGRVWLAFPLPLPDHLAGRWREAGLAGGGIVGAASKGLGGVHMWAYGWISFDAAPAVQAASIPKETEDHRARAKAAAGVLANAAGIVGALGYGPDTFDLTAGDRGLEALGIIPPELERIVRKWWLWRPVKVRILCPETSPGMVTFMTEVAFVRSGSQKVVKISG